VDAHLAGARGRLLNILVAEYFGVAVLVKSNFVPWREPAWALLRERMAFLAQKCADDSDVVGAAGETAALLADKLAAHVPARLRPG